MDEILKKLLTSDLLSEEVKAEIQASFKQATDQYLSEERAKIEVEVRSTLTEEFVKAREELAEQLDTKIDALLAEEIGELKDDINKFRDLEVEHAERLVEEKEALAQQLNEQLNTLTDQVDAFLEVVINEEMAELKDDILEAKKQSFGKKIIEAFEAEYKQLRRAELPEIEQELAEAKDSLADALRRLNEIEGSRLAEARTAKLDTLLSPLGGSAREQMKLILSNVATEKLDEAYKVYIPRVLREAASAPVIDAAPAAKDKLVEDKGTAGKVITGNDVDEAVPAATKPSDQMTRLRKLAGL